jgi:pyruvate kinase
MAEIQEEVLWLCEARVPVIWATQVLETLAKEGLPSPAADEPTVPVASFVR